MKLSARDIATRRIEGQCKRFPQLDLAPLDIEGLDRRDATLAQAIDHEVARRWLTLVAVLSSRLNRRWENVEPRAQAGLLVGAAQLLLFDRLPAHAVIDAAVSWTSRRAGRGAGGLVNAVLRQVDALCDELIDAPSRLARNELPRSDGRVLRLSDEVFASNELTRHAEQTSHPEALLQRWVKTHGGETAARIALHDLVQAPILVTDATSEDWGAPHDTEGFVVYGGPLPELADRLRRDGTARVQDPAAAAAVEATRHLEPEVIIDACAGRGTKTRQLLSVHPNSHIIATDMNDERREVLRETFASTSAVEVIEPLRLLDHAGRADLLLLDVLCSNTGVLARRVEARYRFDAESLEGLVGLQRQIIADTLALVADNGRVLYSTCSLEAEENEEQAEWICHWHHLRIADSRLTLPRGGPGSPPSGYSDGGYFALLERS